MKYIHALLLLFVSTVTLANNIDPKKTFEEANRLYEQKEYKQAADKYETLIENNYITEEIYFNLGNSYYQLHNVAPSIYNYKKALVLNPENKTVLANLKFANSMKLDTFEKKTKLSSDQILHNTIGFFDQTQWAYFAIGASFMVLICFLVYYLSSNSTVKKLFFALQIIGIGSILVGYYAANSEQGYQQTQRYAIVFAEETALKTEPRTTAKDARKIHEGTEVFIVEETSKWVKVLLPNQEMGWLEKEKIKEI